MTEPKKSKRGFAAMSPETQRAIASKGGRASHARGTGHEWDSKAARAAGRKGGLMSRGGRGKAAEETPTATPDPSEPEVTYGDMVEVDPERPI